MPGIVSNAYKGQVLKATPEESEAQTSVIQYVLYYPLSFSL
jgi:hypothetical protein